MANGSETLVGFILLGVGLVFSFLPSIIANRRKHPRTTWIFLLNLLTGWTVIGWFAALIWSASSIKDNPKPATKSFPATRNTDPSGKVEKPADNKE